MAKCTKLSLVMGLVIFVAACVSQVNPIWETYFSTTNNKNNIEWLKSSTMDNNGDMVFTGSSIITGSVRTEDGLLFKYDQNGNQIWFSTFDFSLADGSVTSDEKLLDSVLDQNGNIYSVGQRRIKTATSTQPGSFVLKADQDGQLLWITEISQDQDAFDIEIFEGSIYVTGNKTQRLSFSGKIKLEIPHTERAWDLEVDTRGNIYVAGQDGLKKYSSQGELIWQQQHGAGATYSARVNIELDDQDGVVLLQPELDSTNSLLQRYTAFGELLWSKTLYLVDDGYSLAGKPAMVVERGQIWAAASDTFQRTVVNLTYQGQTNWTYTDSTGPIHDMARLENGNIAITGAGNNALLTPQGKLLATNKTADAGNSLSGSMLVNGNKMFVGTSVSRGDSIQVHLAMFEE